MAKARHVRMPHKEGRQRRPLPTQSQKEALVSTRSGLNACQSLHAIWLTTTLLPPAAETCQRPFVSDPGSRCRYAPGSDVAVRG